MQDEPTVDSCLGDVDTTIVKTEVSDDSSEADRFLGFDDVKTKFEYDFIHLDANFVDSGKKKRKKKILNWSPRKRRSRFQEENDHSIQNISKSGNFEAECDERLSVVSSNSTPPPMSLQSDIIKTEQKYELNSPVDNSNDKRHSLSLRPDRRRDYRQQEELSAPCSDLSHPKYKKPFDYGWRRELVLRATVGAGIHRVGDVYYYRSDGFRCRSMVDLAQIDLPRGLSMDNFSFHPTPTGVNDIWKETIRAAVFRDKESVMKTRQIVRKKLATNKGKLSREKKNGKQSTLKGKSRTKRINNERVAKDVANAVLKELAMKTEMTDEGDLDLPNSRPVSECQTNTFPVEANIRRDSSTKHHQTPKIVTCNKEVQTRPFDDCKEQAILIDRLHMENMFLKEKLSACEAQLNFHLEVQSLKNQKKSADVYVQTVSEIQTSEFVKNSCAPAGLENVVITVARDQSALNSVPVSTVNDFGIECFELSSDESVQSDDEVL